MTQVRGYCRTTEERIALRAFGLSPKHIYSEGSGAETLKACIQSLRDRAGTIYVFGAREASRRVGRVLVVSMLIPELIGELLKAKNLRRICAAIT